MSQHKSFHVSWCEVDWSDDAQDPADYMHGMEFDTIEEARAFAIDTSQIWNTATVSEYAPEWCDGHLVPEWKTIAEYDHGEVMP